MNTRQFDYIKQDEDVLELEVDWAINQTGDLDIFINATEENANKILMAWI